ncbi:MAG TPA: F0F1 ATP synthase subunit A [Chthonomonadaceae bacterium]|nr:F0F1 ATP synthase subunit A [Chthonomonadaceae bacterium]
MPQSHTDNLHARQRILLAQAETGGTPVEGRTATHATTEAAGGHEEAENPGAVPNATLLFANSVLVALILLGFALAARRRAESIPRGFQNFAEWVVESLNKFTVGIIGPGGEKYTPLVGTVFLYIYLSNLIGIIPGFHSPTTNLTITLALGVVVFVYVQYQGIRQNGLVGYVKHFMGPMPALSPLIAPVEIISECIKPFTLAVRLFGNIFGEDVILIVLASIGVMFLPLHLLVVLLAMLTDFVQAMVFAILTCIYISLMSHHGPEEHAHEEGEGPTEAMAHAHETSP